MSTFFEDAEAQARYREAFPEPKPADTAPLFKDAAAQKRYEAEGFRETPGVTYGERKTWNQILAERGTGGPMEAPPEDAFVGGLPEGAVFAESGGRLSQLLRNRQSSTLAP